MKTIEQIEAEIKEFEQDLTEDEAGGWVLGDAHEALDHLRRRLAEMKGSKEQNTVIGTNINRTGYLVTHQRKDSSPRTYACTDRASLSALIFYLTGRTESTFPIDQTRNLPSVPGLVIADKIHIWGASLGRPAIIEGKEIATIPLTGEMGQ